jgi:hypothetical protein
VTGWSPADLLPGLYAFGLAVALAAALRRWYDPVPPRLLAVFALAVSLLFGSSLFGGRLLLPLGNLVGAVPFRGLPLPPPGNYLQGDLIQQIAPWQLEVRRAVFDGRWPLWNARSGAGMPLLGDPQSQAFQPLVAVAWLLPFRQAAAAVAALRVLAALIFSFLFLRRLDLGEAAALSGALAYGLGGFLLWWLGWPIANGAALLPALLYAVARCDQVSRRRDEILLFLATAGVLLGGHPETQLYALACAGCFLLARVWDRMRTERRAGLVLLARCGAAMALAGLALAPVLLPVAEYLPQTHRANIVAYRQQPQPVAEILGGLGRRAVRTAWAERAAYRLLPIAAPRSFGDLAEYWGGDNMVEDTSGAAGAAALLAALVALMPARRRFPQERLAIGILLACLLLLAQPPGFDNLFFRLPVLGATAVHHHHRVLMLVNLAVAWLAACEVERRSIGEARRAAVVLGAAALAALIVAAYLCHPSPATGRIVSGFLAGGLAAQLAALALAAVLLLLPPARLRWAPWAFAALVAAELGLLHHGANTAADRVYAYRPQPSIAFLQRSLGPYRMIGLVNAFPPNVPAVYGLRDARIDNPSQPAAYAHLTSPLNRNPQVPRFGRPGHPLYDLLGVRYILARAGVRLTRPLRLVYRDPETWVWERPGALPPLFLPPRARVHHRGSWLEWVQGNSDFTARALVAPTPEHRRLWRAKDPAGSRVTLRSLGTARLSARAVLAEPRLLASNVFQDGNWHLLSGGARVRTTLVNGPFVGAWLPAGEHELQLLYRPVRFVAGCLLGALALAAAAAWWVPRPAFPRCYPDSDGSDPRPG